MTNKLTIAEAEAAGYTVDKHCFPPVAYKGARFDPLEIFPLSVSETSDGYHTFDELYRHRAILLATLCGVAYAYIDSGPDGFSMCRSKQHAEEDTPMYEGMFIVVLELPYGLGQVSYHCDLELWDWFPHVPEVPRAPKWDGHSPNMAIERMLQWVQL